MVVPLRADCRLIKRGTALSALWKTKVRNAVYFYFFTFRYYENSLFNVLAALHFIFFSGFSFSKQHTTQLYGLCPESRHVVSLDKQHGMLKERY